MKSIIRVATFNNFNFTDKESKALNHYKDKGNIFVNSNSLVKIKSEYKSIITINPYLTFSAPKGDISNVCAFRVKLFHTTDKTLAAEQEKALNYCIKNNIPALITLMRFNGKKSLEKYNIVADQYTWKGNYYRLKSNNSFDKKLNSMFKGKRKLLKYCDKSGEGCPDCNNCNKLTYNKKGADILGLNLSISGIKDKKGKKGLCQFNCPDCFAKKITRGSSPLCDKITKNNKQKGKSASK